MKTTITTQMVLDAALELAVDQYLGGETIASICRRTGYKHTTFTDHLKRIGAHRPGRGGPARIDFCSRGHDMAVHGKPNAGNRGGRYCSECKRIRERVSK